MIAVLGILSVVGILLSLILLVVAIIKKTNNKKRFGISLIACFLVFLFAVSLPEEDTSPVVTDNISQNVDPQPVQTEEIDEGSIGANEILSTDSFDISIVDMKWTNALETSLGTIEPDSTDKGLLCIIFSARNKTDDEQNVAGISLNSYVDGTKVLPKVVAGSIDDAIVFVGAVSPGMEIVGHVVWELPNDWAEFQASYIDDATLRNSEQHFTIYKNDIA